MTDPKKPRDYSNGKHYLDVVENFDIATLGKGQRTWHFRVDDGNEFEYMEVSDPFDSIGRAWQEGREEMKALGLVPVDSTSMPTFVALFFGTWEHFEVFGPPQLTDEEKNSRNAKALDEIAALLEGKEWNELAADVATILENTGRNPKELEDEE